MSAEGQLDLRLLAQRSGEADLRGVVSLYSVEARTFHQPQEPFSRPDQQKLIVHSQEFDSGIGRLHTMLGTRGKEKIRGFGQFVMDGICHPYNFSEENLKGRFGRIFNDVL